jgi:hypothetical protein
MAMGRLIKVRNHFGDPATAFFVVAEANGAAAIDVLQNALSSPDSEYQDLGRMNESFIDALGLKPGQFSRL